MRFQNFRWIKPGEQISFHGFSSSLGNFYYSDLEQRVLIPNIELLASEIGWQESKPFIPNIDFTTNKNFWMKIPVVEYKSFLAWIESDKNYNRLTINGFQHYFNGIQRRILHDTNENLVDNVEYRNLFQKLKNLYAHFINHKKISFQIRQLLEIMAIKNLNQVDLDWLLVNPMKPNLLLKFLFAKHATSKIPISKEIAFGWFIFNHQIYNGDKSYFNFDEFKKIFYDYFDSYLKEKWIIETKGFHEIITYSIHCTSCPTKVVINKEFYAGKLPIKAQRDFIHIGTKVNSRVEKIHNYLKTISLKFDEKSSNLVDDYDSQRFKNSIKNRKIELNRIRNWILSHQMDLYYLVDFQELIAFLTNTIESSVLEVETTILKLLIQDTGYGVSPISEFHIIESNPYNQYVLFEFSNKKLPFIKRKQTDFYQIIISSAVWFNSSSTKYLDILFPLNNYINCKKNINETEKKLLNAYAYWLFHIELNLGDFLNKRISNLVSKEKRILANMLEYLVPNDNGFVNSITKNRLNQMVYWLKIPENDFSKELNYLIKEGKILNYNSITFSRKNIELKELDFVIRETIITEKALETSQIKDHLQHIFKEDEMEENHESKVLKENFDLDNENFEILKFLFKRDYHKIESILLKCNELKLMADNSIELINDWALELFDDVLIEKESDLFLIVEETKNLILKKFSNLDWE